MGIFSKLFGHKSEAESKVGGMEDYMLLVRVYFQSALATRLGITSLRMLPDLHTFKATFHVPTVNNKLGVGEKKEVRKMMGAMYKTSDDFFDEIDKSIKKNCRHMQDLQPYLYQFQGFTQELMMLIGNLMKFKLRVPGFFRKAIYAMTEKTVDDIFEKNDYKDAAVIKSVLAVRKYDERLGFSRRWITDFIFQIVLLAKKEPKPKDDDVKQKK